MSMRSAVTNALIVVGVLGSATIVVIALVTSSSRDDQPVLVPTPSVSSPTPRSTPTTRPVAAELLLEARAKSDGTFDVTETVTFRRPQNWLLLTPPKLADGASALVSARPRAVQFRLSSDGNPLPTATDEVAKATDVYLDNPVSKVELRYKLVGATSRSTPSVSGRSLALLAPLALSTDETLPTSLKVSGATVRNLVCPQLPVERRLCAVTDGAGLELTGVSAGEAIFIVQLDLPSG